MNDEQFDDRFNDQFDALLRDAARTYNRPSEPLVTDAMWAAIDRALPPGIVGPHGVERPPLMVMRDDHVAPNAPRRSAIWKNGWLRAAAVLLIGVALGRASVHSNVPNVANAPSPSVATATRDSASAPAASDVRGVDLAMTNEYLGRTQALLAALPSELRARHADPAYLSRADALLLQTRLLLDSPASADPALHSLFDDLEIVLAQVVRLQTNRDPTRLDFLQQAIEQRDVLPRLRDAVADNAGD